MPLPLLGEGQRLLARQARAERAGPYFVLMGVRAATTMPAPESRAYRHAPSAIKRRQSLLGHRSETSA